MIAPSRPEPDGSRPLRLRHVVEHAAHLLPVQGPIGVFIHHNTLHSFQHLSFEDAVVAASKIYGSEPFMSEAAYRGCLAAGRIRADDIRAVVDREPNAEILPGTLSRRALRTSLLIGGQTEFDSATVEWTLEETDLLERNGHGLFAACLALVEPERQPAQRPARPRDGLLPLTGVDLDEVTHPLLIRLAGAFLDQGIAYWPMPNRQDGFLHSVRDVLGPDWALYPEYLERLGHEFRWQAEQSMDAEAVIIAALDRMGVRDVDWESVLQSELLALPGWPGLIRQLELKPELAPHVELPCSLMDFLAVRLTLGLVAAAGVLKEKGLSALALSQWHAQTEGAPPSLNQRRASAANLWDAIVRLGFTERELTSWNPVLQRRLLNEIKDFDSLERRRLLHLAYEFRHERDILEPLALHRKNHPPVMAAQRPCADVFCCLDEREESLRRHLEEVMPGIRTHGIAGFFGIAMEYAGIDDAHGVPLCPVVVTPRHSVREHPIAEHTSVYKQRIGRRRTLAGLARNIFIASRTLFRGWVSTAALGPLALVPLVTRVLSPLSYGRFERAVLKSLIPRPATQVAFTRTQAGNMPGGLLQGFTLQEMLDRVAGTLGNAGLRGGFARLVFVLGHGSTSLNNPHESAHDCGACGGRRGGPSGRTFAAMANDPDVRNGLHARGVEISPDVWFIGGYHDTCNAEIVLLELDRLPESHRAEFATLRAAFDTARARDAEERARRFEAASSHGGPAQALRHVQDRADQLGEPRPEYGHATNAVCIVGRRELTRGLFLDRRAFLVSYDAAQDPQDASLAGLLGAVIPVCAGISLEYYFSYVDNERYGCGTKLPHNITGLVGVMNGSGSDLRTGLPWQMVEVHEPVRILFVLETTPQRLMKVIAANPELTEFQENRWIRLATIDPDTGEVQVLRDLNFEKLNPSLETIPSAPSSVEWFRGRIEHLPIAHIACGAE
jgi:uncharacterized protein YbcC (UPF0753/DUF2309 family)